jgi:Na+-transporting methylmalonyl-CoA/oxaloacetate decarboxylase gamma subunit
VDRGDRLPSTVYGQMENKMSDAFTQSLQITAIGMGLVFAAIILLWWMMNLLTFITADKEVVSESSAGMPSAVVMDDERKAQAAAVAVAIALAEQQASASQLLTEPSPTIVSAWQLGMRTRQMYQKGSSIRHRTL